jgi:hypothetical protein
MASSAPPSSYDDSPSVKVGLEDCAWCVATGRSADGKCPACEGTGSVSVVQPPIKCPRCFGEGRTTDRTEWTFPRCIVCLGTGWSRRCLRC